MERVLIPRSDSITHQETGWWMVDHLSRTDVSLFGIRWYYPHQTQQSISLQQKAHLLPLLWPVVEWSWESAPPVQLALLPTVNVLYSMISQYNDPPCFHNHVGNECGIACHWEMERMPKQRNGKGGCYIISTNLTSLQQVPSHFNSCHIISSWAPQLSFHGIRANNIPDLLWWHHVGWVGMRWTRSDRSWRRWLSASFQLITRGGGLSGLMLAWPLETQCGILEWWILRELNRCHISPTQNNPNWQWYAIMFNLEQRAIALTLTMRAHSTPQLITPLFWMAVVKSLWKQVPRTENCPELCSRRRTITNSQSPQPYSPKPESPNHIPEEW